MSHPSLPNLPSISLPIPPPKSTDNPLLVRLNLNIRRKEKKLNSFLKIYLCGQHYPNIILSHMSDIIHISQKWKETQI